MQKNEILIFEKSDSLRNQLIKLLEGWGCILTVAYDGKDILGKLQEKQFPLIVASFELEDVDGIELLKEIKEKYLETQVLFLSENVSVSNVVLAMREGALDFILKPIVPEQIRIILQKVFPQEKAYNPKSRAAEKLTTGKPIITKNLSMLKLLDLARKVSDSSASVLVQGESGTGKELLANFIHQNSSRKDKNFVAINCATLPENLLESELFGHEKGSFTGAINKKIGKFELANQGTIFLDEITEMQFNLQAKLLRVIQERKLDRIGGMQPVPVDIRIIASTNRDIQEAIKSNQFREDLFYRLNVVPMKIPPLRLRKDDIELLCEFFIKKYNEIDNKNIKNISKDALSILLNHPFKGNVRELENIIQRAILFADSQIIQAKDLFLNEEFTQNLNIEIEKAQTLNLDIAKEFSGTLSEIEKQAILQALEKTKGNRTYAAEMLGISIRTLRNKLNEYNETIENSN